jgi:predicted NAD-dependent protein-ADP-ribosyltransferase YbiA (DUF1768 family)
MRPDWGSVKVGFLRSAVLAKFTQNEELRSLLLSTDDAELVDRTGNDYGGDDGDVSDKNVLGCVLMEVSESLRAAEGAEPLSRPTD